MFYDAVVNQYKDRDYFARIWGENNIYESLYVNR